MFIKIFFNDKPLFLCDEMNAEMNSIAHHDDGIFMDEFSTPAVNSIIHEMRLEKVHAGVFYHRNLEQLKKAFWKKFLIVKAGGGVVKNRDGKTLFIFRRNKWDLPKGKLDPGETLEQCALREVSEETGVKSVKLDKYLLTTYHTYDESGKHILKESWWYRMHANGNEPLVPQLNEQITALKWIGGEELSTCLGNTYPSIADVILEDGLQP